jgi:hypothetical protein
VTEYDREASIMRRLWPTGGCCTMEKEVKLNEYHHKYPKIMGFIVKWCSRYQRPGARMFFQKVRTYLLKCVAPSSTRQ